MTHLKGGNCSKRGPLTWPAGNPPLGGAIKRTIGTGLVPGGRGQFNVRSCWLAWACGVPVVLISGFTHPTNEFDTLYRVVNYHACNSCWNDVRVRFDHKDFLWCPRHKDTPRQFECTRLITADQVKAVIKRIPGFGMSGRSAAA